LGNRPGINLLKDFSDKTVWYIKERVQKVKQQRDIVIASIHWGGNWGYEIPYEEIKFAHMLVDNAGIDIIHGHSSHHIKGIEVYKERLIVYGCGDFLNDYEGIGGYETFRNDLGFMYFADIEAWSGKLIHLQMTPTHIRRFKVNRASTSDAVWLRDILNREGKRFMTRAELNKDNTITLQWD
jgi:poly-gamma-glutamate synthesis protein (capsule biosynthesis protein)